MPDNTGNSAWHWECDDPRHEHRSWEEADWCANLLPLLARLQCALGETALSYARPVIMGDSGSPVLMPNPDETYSQIYTELRKLYESAGQPDGPDEADFWNWMGKIWAP